MDSYEQFQKVLQYKKMNANSTGSNRNRLKKLATELNNLRSSDSLCSYKQNIQTKKTRN